MRLGTRHRTTCRPVASECRSRLRGTCCIRQLRSGVWIWGPGSQAVLTSGGGGLYFGDTPAACLFLTCVTQRPCGVRFASDLRFVRNSCSKSASAVVTQMPREGERGARSQPGIGRTVSSHAWPQVARASLEAQPARQTLPARAAGPPRHRAPESVRTRAHQ